MRGIGVQAAKGFWAEAWSRVLRRRGAVLGMCWLGIVAFFAVNIAAMAARIAWGWVADRGGGTRRVRALVEVGLLAAAGGVAFALALHLGAVAVVLA